MFDFGDFVTFEDRQRICPGLPVTFEARLSQGGFQAENIRVVWTVVRAHQASSVV